MCVFDMSLKLSLNARGIRISCSLGEVMKLSRDASTFENKWVVKQCQTSILKARKGHNEYLQIKWQVIVLPQTHTPADLFYWKWQLKASTPEIWDSRSFTPQSLSPLVDQHAPRKGGHDHRVISWVQELYHYTADSPVVVSDAPVHLPKWAWLLNIIKTVWRFTIKHLSHSTEVYNQIWYFRCPPYFGGSLCCIMPLITLIRHLQWQLPGNLKNLSLFLKLDDFDLSFEIENIQSPSN